MKRTLFFWKRILTEYKQCKFRPWYLEQLLNGRTLSGNPTLITTLHLGDKNPHKTIAFIVLDRSWTPTAGFFALLNRTLCALYYADKMGFTPVISNWDGCAYEESTEINGTRNVFEYYFSQPTSCGVSDALYSNTVYIPTNNNMDVLLHECKSQWYDLSFEYLKKMGDIYKKYLHFNPETESAISHDVDNVILSKKTLAIHYRGSDYRINANGHPKSLLLEDYYPYIEQAMQQEKYDYIFVATDDLSALDELKKRYKNVVYFEDTLRTSGDVSVAFLKNDRTHHKYRLGYEVLRDAYALSWCDGLIAGHSQVASGAQIMKFSRNERYSYCKMLENGINHNSNDWITVYKKLKETNGEE